MTLAKPPSSPLEAIADELLYAIIDYSDFQDLANLSMVSRRFYIPTFDILYGTVNLSFTTGSGFSDRGILFYRQITHPKSRIWKRVHFLCVTGGEILQRDESVALQMMFSEMKNLKRLEWIGLPDLFDDLNFLDFFHLRFPRTKLVVRDNDVLGSYGSSPRVAHAIGRLLEHAVSPRITTLWETDELYTNFKRDLMFMIRVARLSLNSL